MATKKAATKTPENNRLCYSPAYVTIIGPKPDLCGSKTSGNRTLEDDMAKNEATKLQQEKIAAGEAAAAEMLQGKHWASWMIIAEALDVGRTIAMKRAKCKEREGKAYCTAFSEWLDEETHEHLRRVSASAMSYLDKCWQERKTIEKWRGTLTDDQRLQWNHPQTVWTHFSKATKVPESKDEGQASDGEGGEAAVALGIEGPSEDASPKVRARHAATTEFVEFAVTAVENGELQLPTLISWLEEMDVEEAIGALREYMASQRQPEAVE